jgi:hypothetical protein
MVFSNLQTAYYEVVYRFFMVFTIQALSIGTRILQRLLDRSNELQCHLTILSAMI